MGFFKTLSSFTCLNKNNTKNPPKKQKTQVNRLLFLYREWVEVRTVRHPQIFLVNRAIAKVRLERTKSLPVMNTYYWVTNIQYKCCCKSRVYSCIINVLFFKVGGRFTYYSLYLSSCNGCLRQDV